MSEPVRRRGVLGISGWLLFACLFLPTLRVCGDPMMPVQFPPTYGVYLGGILVAVIGFSTLRRSRRNMLLALIGLYSVSAFTFAALFLGGVVATGVGVLAGMVFLVLLWFMMRRAALVNWSERAVAIGCFVHAMVAAGWSALLAFDPEGMWGAQVSLGAASLMLFAAGGYLVHEIKDPSAIGDDQPIPEARMV
jgi:hypothetical protein